MPSSRHSRELRARLAAAAAVVVIQSGPAPAQQRAQDSAVGAAEDAFGTTIGLQNVGLYSQTDARGFNPQQAGNLRIEGLYFDQQTWVSNSCTFRETAMRIGIAAQSYAFPSPTGIADLLLRTPGEGSAFSGILSHGPYNGSTVQLEQQVPVAGKSLSADVCGAFYKNILVDNMRRDDSTALGVTLRWRPNESTEVVPFWSYLAGGGHQVLPSVYTDGTVPLYSFRERDLGTQTWTDQAWRMTTLGVIIKSQLTDHWHLDAGLFHSQERDPWGFDPYLQLNTDGTAESSIDVQPRLAANSTSGELRLTGLRVRDAHRQQLQFAVRGRAVERSYGGDENFYIGNITLNDQTQYDQPSIELAPRSFDLVRELDVGATYEERWDGVGTAAIGVLKENYRRTAEVPDLAAAAAFRTTPWLGNARLALEAGKGVQLYASYTQGLEDSALAPISAFNRGEPPAAARTWQVDGGVRYAPSAHVRVILGGFEIHKPYLNVDLDNIYRPLGRLRNKGVEASFSYNNAGLTLLGGGVWLRPHVELSAAQPGIIATVPIGPVPITLNANVDYAPPAWGPWGASLQWNRLSTRVADNGDQQLLPALSTWGAGIRYQWKLRANSWTLRLDGFNLTDAQGLHVSALGLVLPEQGRRYTVTLATDL